MFEGTGTATSAHALELIASGLDELCALDFVAADDSDILRTLRGLQKVRRRLESIDHPIITEVDARGMAGERGCTSTTAMLGRLQWGSPRQ